jgi:hypothetical protein
MFTTVDNPDSYIQSLGGLHDARMEGFELNLSNRTLTIAVDDLNSAFLDLPEYEGHYPADICLSGVSTVTADFEWAGRILSIYELAINRIDGQFGMQLKLAPSGSLVLTFQAMKVLRR